MEIIVGVIIESFLNTDNSYSAYIFILILNYFYCLAFILAKLKEYDNKKDLGREIRIGSYYPGNESITGDDMFVQLSFIFKFVEEVVKNDYW